MIPKPCIEVGCPNLSMPGPRHARCPDHERQWQAARNRRPERAAYRDPAYRRLRIPVTCSVPGCTGRATKDHITELHQGGTNNPSNIQPLCIKHNVSKSNDQRKK
jgi:hypothetical protein